MSMSTLSRRMTEPFHIDRGIQKLDQDLRARKAKNIYSILDMFSGGILR